MKYAFNDDGTLRDVVMTEPRLVFVPGYAEQFIEVPDDAQTGYVWNGTHFAPPAGPTFEELKAAKLETVATARRKAIDDGFMHNGILWDSDANARIAYAELAMRYQYDPAFVTTWKASDGYWVEMTATLFQAVYAAGSEHVQTCFAWQAAKEEEIRACERVEELEAVVVTV